MNIAILGLTITSSWGNGHATTYRALVRELTRNGHQVVFFECDKPWYAENRDLPIPPYGDTILYRDLSELQEQGAEIIRGADAVIVGSYVPDGVTVGAWATAISNGVTAFYDIDTPVTMAKLRRGDYEYISPELIPSYNIYLSFAGGPILDELKQNWGAPLAAPLYCSVDTELLYPDPKPPQWDLGYLGTYSDDRQPSVERFLLRAAAEGKGKFVVAGPGYPDSLVWPENVTHLPHLPPNEHRDFYNTQRFTLNVTRADMIAAGFSPSVRLFEAAACGVPILSDWWEGLDTFFVPDREIAVVETTEDVLRWLWDVPEDKAREMGAAARERILSQHTAAHRAVELQQYIEQAAETIAR